MFMRCARDSILFIGLLIEGVINPSTTRNDIRERQSEDNDGDDIVSPSGSHHQYDHHNHRLKQIQEASTNCNAHP